MSKQGRPPVPLIHKDAVVAAALDLIDANGLDALTLRRLGSSLGIHGMSLYHHFADKQAILDAVARSILKEIRPPKKIPSDFVEWSTANALRARRGLLAHPNAIPLFVARHPHATRKQMYESEFTVLAAHGVAERYWILLVESLEAFVVGSALYLRPVDASADALDALTPTQREYDLAFELAYRAFAADLLTHYRDLSAAHSDRFPAGSRTLAASLRSAGRAPQIQHEAPSADVVL